MTKYLVFLALVVGFPTAMKSINPDCDFYRDVVPGKRYSVYNSEYPSYYNGARSCRWYARSTTKLNINCQIFSLPATTNCAGDRFAVSPSGDLNLADARNYCGTGTFNITSDSNTMDMVFTSYAGTTGGRFYCTLQAVSIPTPTCNCGYKKQSKIVGGTAPGVNEYPMMAGIVNLQDRQLTCGGTIISNRYVMSAAHCFLRLAANQVAVLVGDHDISTGAETSASKLILIINIATHPAFELKGPKNDISILTTQDPIIFSMEVGPACLPFRYAATRFTAEKVDALGWGLLEFAGEKPDILQKVTLNVTQLETCQRTFPDVTDNQICTYTPNKDTCQFDSGGPLLYESSNSMKLISVGIVSYGLDCANRSPSVNTRVGAYLDWILSVTPGANYCRAE